MAKRYKSEGEYRQTIEKELRTKIPNEVWKIVCSVDCNPPYDQTDKKELIDKLADMGINEVKEDQPNTPAYIRSNIYARRALPEVEKIREPLFGSSDAPFEGDMIAAAEWLEVEAAKQPRAEGHAPRYGYKLSDKELQSLSVEKMKLLQKEKPGIYGVEIAILGYGRESGWTHYVVVSDGTNIRRLWLGANSIAKKLGCQQAQATAFILTGLWPYVAPIIIRSSGGFDDIGVNARGKVEITITGPISIEVLIRAYRKILKKTWGKERSPKQITKRDELHIYFSEEKIDFDNPNWEECRKRWNQSHPEFRYDNRTQFRTAVDRAYNRIFPEANPFSNWEE